MVCLEFAWFCCWQAGCGTRMQDSADRYKTQYHSFIAGKKAIKTEAIYTKTKLTGNTQTEAVNITREDTMKNRGRG